MMPNDQYDPQCLEAVLRNLIRAAHSFLELTRQDEIAKTDEWRDLASANGEAATKASELRSRPPGGPLCQLGASAT